MQNLIVLLGRIFLSSIFLMSGFKKITSFAGTQQYMEGNSMPIAAFFLVGAIILEVFGGLSVLLGYKARWGAFALVIFLIPATLIFHTQLSDQMQMIMFMKNIAILGGLFMILSYGSGSMSIDSRSPTPKQENV